MQYYTECECENKWQVFVIAEASELYLWFIKAIMDHITHYNHEVIVKVRVI